jgi:hypothetical protein
VERGFSYQLEVGAKGRFLIGGKGAVLAEQTRIPYTLDWDVLELGEVVATLPKVGDISLKGKWKKVGEK